MKVNEKGWITSLSDSELERLEVAFASVAEDRDEDRNIAAWIAQLRSNKLAITKMRAKAGYDEWGSPLPKKAKAMDA